MTKNYYNRGFTLIELLVVISIIGLLSSVVLASLNTARAKGRDAKKISDLIQVRDALELYASDHAGSYPSTGGFGNVYMDPGCTFAHDAGSGDVTQADWVPGLTNPKYISVLPQDPHPLSSVPGDPGVSCYMYASDGVKYILTSWGTVESGTNGGKMDSNFGFREIVWESDESCYYSNGGYASIDNVHRRSFTLTNLDPNTDTDPTHSIIGKRCYYLP